MARVIFLADFSEAYTRSLLKGIVQYAQGKDAWSITKIPPSVRDKHGLEEVIMWAKRTKADAIIGQFYNNDPVELFRENGIIAIALDFKKRFDTIPNITGTYKLAGQMGAEYFINKGFKNFAFYGRQEVIWSEERCSGFKDTINKLLPNAFVSEYQNNNLDILWYYSQANLTNWIKSLPKPIAIMACDDNHAYHITEVCQHIKESGHKIPDNIAVLGVDNDETICNLSLPNISSLAQSVEQGGYDVAKLIDTFVNNPNADLKNIVVKATYIITRASTDICANEDKNIAKALKYIHEKVKDKISVDDVVQQVPLSRRLLELKFKKEMSISIYDYILKIRIEKMTELLRNDMPISQVAFELGFSDTKNISRTFKQFKGLTPSEYKEMIKEEERKNCAI